MSDRSLRKSPTNLSVRADLVRQAKDLRINLSELLEEALQKAIVERAREEWLSVNEEAISEYNQAVAGRALFGDQWRRF